MANNILNPSTSQFQYLLITHYRWHTTNKLTLSFFFSLPPSYQGGNTLNLMLSILRVAEREPAKTTRMLIGFPH